MSNFTIKAEGCGYIPTELDTTREILGVAAVTTALRSIMVDWESSPRGQTLWQLTVHWGAVHYSPDNSYPTPINPQPKPFEKLARLFVRDPTAESLYLLDPDAYFGMYWEQCST